MPLLKLRLFSYLIGSRSFTNTAILRKWQRPDPGISKQMKILDGDDPFREDVQDEEDIAALESDFANMEQAYDKDRRDRWRKRDYVGKKIVIKKFFSGPKPPNMLTWAERQQIKYLNKKDAEEWNIQVLAESFPASKETIIKILKGKWVAENPEKMKRRDAIVTENWRLLSEGKLEADSELIDHLKKFIGRREQYLSSINLAEISAYLSPPKQEKIRWNNGQMTSILESYERKLIQLEAKQKKLMLQIPDNSNNPNIVTKISNTEEVLLSDPTKRSKVKINDKPPSLMNKNLRNAGESNIFEARDKKGSNRGYLKPETGIKTNNLDDLDSFQVESIASQSNENQRSTATKKVTPPLIVDADYESTLPEEFELRENDTKELKFEELRHILEKNLLPHKTLSKNETAAFKKSGFVYNPEIEEVKIQKEERSIENTFFWSDNGDENNLTPESGTTAATKRNTKGLALYDYGYPEKINIPMEKQGSGLTFRVNDCFYDDDGEFLYRVPGITRATTENSEETHDKG